MKSRTYLGETGHKGHWFPGEHEPIVPRGIFEQVQHLLKTNSVERSGRRQQTGALLTGLLFDDRGNRMSPSFSVKNGVRYPFYVSSALLGRRKAQAGSITRASATEIETAVLGAVRDRIDAVNEHTGLTSRQAIDQFVERVVVRANRITITLKANSAPIEIPWAPTRKCDLAQIEHDPTRDDRRAPDPQLVQALVRAHIWLRSLADGTYDSIEDLARAADLHPKVIRNRIRIAFLAPDVTRRILQGTLRSATTVGVLTDLGSLSWHEQRHLLRSGGQKEP